MAVDYTTTQTPQDARMTMIQPKGARWCTRRIIAREKTGEGRTAVENLIILEPNTRFRLKKEIADGLLRKGQIKAVETAIEKSLPAVTPETVVTGQDPHDLLASMRPPEKELHGAPENK